MFGKSDGMYGVSPLLGVLSGMSFSAMSPLWLMILGSAVVGNWSSAAGVVVVVVVVGNPGSEVQPWAHLELGFRLSHRRMSQ